MLVDALLDAARSEPNAPAVADQHLTFSYKSLARLYSVFRRLVMRETTCERIGLMLPSSAVFPAALMGTLWAERRYTSIFLAAR